jgi:protein involved in polysaccharide export with SLBB domain
MQQPFMQKLFLRFLWSLLGISVLAVAGCSSNPMSPVSYSQSAQNAQAQLPIRSSAGSYALGTNDQLRVQVYNEPTITGDYVVDGAGFLSIPVAGRIKAAGLTTQQLERSVTAKLNGGILKDARVTIRANEGKAYVRPSGGTEMARPLDVDPAISPGDNIRIPERFF